MMNHVKVVQGSHPPPPVPFIALDSTHWTPLAMIGRGGSGVRSGIEDPCGVWTGLPEKHGRSDILPTSEKRTCYVFHSPLAFKDH